MQCYRGCEGGLGLIKKQRRKFKRRRVKRVVSRRVNQRAKRGNGELGSFGRVIKGKHGEE